jgi:transposase
MTTKKKKRKRREFTPEFKAEAIKLVRAEGLSQAQVARDLGLSPSMVGRWLAQAERDRAPGALSPEERAELKRLRRENKVLRTEREILKKAAAFFAKESL